jgi:NAD(P)H-nitrite reductase large subunit
MIEQVDYLIIGNSAAAIGAAEAIREVDKTGRLMLCSGEPYHVYSRPLIAEYLACHRPMEKMYYRPAGFYRQNNIQAKLGSAVKHIDPANKAVLFDDGCGVGWQKLLISTGDEPVKPPLPGFGLEGVFTFTRLDDARAIDEYLNQNRVNNAVVIGGGLIGVSVSEALVKRELYVTVVELKERLLNTILDEESSTVVESTLRRSGVTLATGRAVKTINDQPLQPGRVASVTLDDGRSLACQMVIVAIGVRPRMELVQDTGIRVDRGIVVDRHMQTSLSDIYAAGDVVQAYDFIYDTERVVPIWPNACAGGRVAGFNMAGKPCSYEDGTVMNSLKYFGLAMTSIGIVAPQEPGYEVLNWQDNHFYRKIVLRDDRVVGMVLTGDVEYSGVIFSLMKDRVNVSSFKQKLVSPDFNLACLPEDLRRQKLHGISV